MRTASTAPVPWGITPQPLRPQASPDDQFGRLPTPVADPADNKYRLETLELWNSPEMQAAREVVEEFCRRAAHTSPQEGEAFLEQLSRRSPEQMENWLKRFQTRQQRVSRGQEVGQLARQLNVGRSLNKLEAKRIAVRNVAAQRRQAAAAREPAQNSQYRGQGIAWFPIDAAGISKLRYHPMEAVVDPSSPRGYKGKVAAAMSLPGDLPRSDPRNYIRGEEGIDFGEWATSRGAVPPALSVAPA
ncbi:MAG: hypothetical protein ACR2NM_02850, partial [Bythopirellula sp.]